MRTVRFPLRSVIFGTDRRCARRRVHRADPAGVARDRRAGRRDRPPERHPGGDRHRAYGCRPLPRIGRDHVCRRRAGPAGHRGRPGRALGVPQPALRAYRQAAATLADRQTSCQLGWSLLAGIGLIESDHGRYGGAVVGVDGRSRPRILGPRLDGAGPVAAIHDSDGGRLDGDRVWDRAVGPMQFIPQTWASVGADGDGDGVEDPDDIDDAALAAGYYLCASGGVLTDSSARAAQLQRLRGVRSARPPGSCRRTPATR